MVSWEFCSYTWQKDGPGGFAVLSSVGQTNMGISRKPLQNHWLWNAHCKLLCVFLYCRLHCSRQSCCWAEKLVDKLEQPHLQHLCIYAVCTLVVCLNLHSASFCFSNCVTESPSVFLYHFLHFQLGPKPVCHILFEFMQLFRGFFVSFKQFALESWVTNGLKGAESAAVSKHKQIWICSSHLHSRGLK